MYGAHVVEPVRQFHQDYQRLFTHSFYHHAFQATPLLLPVLRAIGDDPLCHKRKGKQEQISTRVK